MLFKKENMSLIFNLISLVIIFIVYLINDMIAGIYPLFFSVLIFLLMLGLFISIIYNLKYSKHKILNFLLSLITLYFGVFNSLIVLLVMMQYKYYYTIIF